MFLITDNGRTAHPASQIKRVVAKEFDGLPAAVQFEMVDGAYLTAKVPSETKDGGYALMMVINDLMANRHLFVEGGER